MFLQVKSRETKSIISGEYTPLWLKNQNEGLRHRTFRSASLASVLVWVMVTFKSHGYVKVWVGLQFSDGYTVFHSGYATFCGGNAFFAEVLPLIWKECTMSATKSCVSTTKNCVSTQKTENLLKLTMTYWTQTQTPTLTLIHLLQNQTYGLRHCIVDQFIFAVLLVHRVSLFIY